MADRRSRRRSIAFGIAVVLALGAAAFLVLSIRERSDARADLATARVRLHRAHATSSTDGQELTQAWRAVQALHAQLSSIASGAGDVGKLDAQDLGAVEDAIRSGLAGNLDGYNTAVDQRATIDQQHDDALEHLREQVNAVITALDQVTG